MIHSEEKKQRFLNLHASHRIEILAYPKSKLMRFTWIT